jgi:hypothetical protein
MKMDDALIGELTLYRQLSACGRRPARLAQEVVARVRDLVG